MILRFFCFPCDSYARVRRTVLEAAGPVVSEAVYKYITH